MKRTLQCSLIKIFFFSNIKNGERRGKHALVYMYHKVQYPRLLILKKNTVIGDFIVNFLNLHEKFIINNHLWYMDLEDSPAFRL